MHFFYLQHFCFHFEMALQHMCSTYLIVHCTTRWHTRTLRLSAAAAAAVPMSHISESHQSKKVCQSLIYTLASFVLILVPIPVARWRYSVAIDVALFILFIITFDSLMQNSPRMLWSSATFHPVTLLVLFCFLFFCILHLWLVCLTLPYGSPCFYMVAVCQSAVDFSKVFKTKK